MDELTRQGHEFADEDVARLSPFVQAHVNTQGRYSFARRWSSEASCARSAILTRMGVSRGWFKRVCRVTRSEARFHCFLGAWRD